MSNTTFAVSMTLLLAVAILPGPEAGGDPCSVDAECVAQEFCKYPTGICYSEEPLGTCVTQGDNCAEYWDPVCGCDFLTYSNEGCAGIHGVSVLYPGVCAALPCGGYLDLPCDEGHFCSVDIGECGIYFGSCLLAPNDCADTCEPVCGCDGLSYENLCDAQISGESALHLGFCDSPTDRIVSGVAFETSTTLSWEHETGALHYNLYRGIAVVPPPADAGLCYLAGIAGTSTNVAEDPPSGETWFLQVTAVFESGEESMGMGSECRNRAPYRPCHPD